MKIMKFGGSSLQTAERVALVLEQIRAASQTSGIAVILSALGGVTDALYEALQQPLTQRRALLLDIIQRHKDIILGVCSHFDLCKQQPSLHWLTHFQKNLLALSERISPEDLGDYAIFMAQGERLSVRTLMCLSEHLAINVDHLPAEQVIHVDGAYNCAQPNHERITHHCKNLAYPANTISLTEGFYGINQAGHLACFSRNGSDLTAAALGCALGADCIEIWTDVDGIYDADPKLVRGARPIRQVALTDIKQYTHYGAKVVFSPTLDYLEAHNIPLQIRNTLKPSSPGTLIAPSDKSSSFFGVTLLDPIGVSQCGDDIILLSLEEKGVGIQNVMRLDKRRLSQGMKNRIATNANQQSLDDCVLISAVGHNFLDKLEMILRNIRQEGIELIQSITFEKSNQFSCIIKRDNCVNALNLIHTLAQ